MFFHASNHTKKTFCSSFLVRLPLEIVEQRMHAATHIPAETPEPPRMPQRTFAPAHRKRII